MKLFMIGVVMTIMSSMSIATTFENYSCKNNGALINFEGSLLCLRKAELNCRPGSVLLESHERRLLCYENSSSREDGRNPTIECENNETLINTTGDRVCVGSPVYNNLNSDRIAL